MLHYRNTAADKAPDIRSICSCRAQGCPPPLFGNRFISARNAPTQSASKVSIIAKVYDEWISQARTQNAIEQGADEPPDDDYVTCRL